MKPIRWIAACAALAGVANAGEIKSVVDDGIANLKDSRPSAIELMAAKNFAITWDLALGESLLVEPQMDGGVEWPATYDAYSSGMTLMSTSEPVYIENIDSSVGDVDQQLFATKENNELLMSLSEEEFSRMFALAQVLKTSNIRDDNGQLELCIFLLWPCSPGPGQSEE
ncbi:hypothetical protein [Devosia sp.]|uniref:hypothetical protein n=1 Tax=Devosia sp. TaxID=1871048 RepID=UPI003A91A984